MARTVLVTGGTGVLGRVVVPRLLDAGHDVRVLSRRQRRDGEVPRAGWHVGDLTTGAGLAEALSGVDTVLHCASDLRNDVTSARLLIDAALTGGAAPHIVYISIVGVDRARYRYYRAKYEVEQQIEESGLPWTVLRTTQWHTLLNMMFTAMLRLPALVVLARTSFQPLDVELVAQRLTQLCGDAPAGLVHDMGGPQVLPMADMARAFLRARDKRRAVLPVWLPGAVGRDFRDGLQLAPHDAVGGRTWEEFLAVSAGSRGGGAA